MLTESPTRSGVVADRRFGAMGSDAHVIVVGATRDAADRAVDAAVARVEQLEARWSRFRATSEISQLNGRIGAPVLVSRDTYRLVEHAVRAWELTEGRYDPTVIDAMVRIGYDRDFAAVMSQPPRRDSAHSSARPAVVGGVAAPGCGAVRLDSYLPAVTLPAGVGFDPGGIGKGLAADIVVDELIAAGARGAMVNLGGDVAVAGQPPDAHGWIVGIEDPNDATRHIARVTLEAGGVCTSSRRRRAWTAGGRCVHHLIDPRSGCPIDTPIVAITVVAGAAWWAEATTKAGFVAGIEGLAAQLVGAHALVVLEDGSIEVFGDRGVFDLDSDAILEASRATGATL